MTDDNETAIEFIGDSTFARVFVQIQDVTGQRESETLVPREVADEIYRLATREDWAEVSDENENLREQYVTVCRDLIAAHQAAMDARRIADALGYALTNAESDSNGDPVGPELDPAIAAWRGRSWRGLVSPEQAAHIREVLGPGIGDALKRTRPE